MPPKTPPKSSSRPLACTHPYLLTSPHPSQSQFSRVSPPRRAAAATATGVNKAKMTDTNFHHFESDDDFASAFPGPLVLKGDDLALDPKQGGQSFRSWERSKDRNLVGGKEGEGKGKGMGKGKGKGEGARRSIYVMGPPGIDGEGADDFMRGWEECKVEGGGKWKGENWETRNWILDVVSYLQAFYHGLPVKPLDSSFLHFTPWDPSPKSSKSNSNSKSNPKSRSRSRSRKKSQPTYIGLRTPTFQTGIRARATPSAPFSHQLNLTDLLDLAIDILPTDAYALMLLVNHDLYEDDDDEFICGRAFGGSRVSVVSRARYNPVLDGVQGVERGHAWPGSHCEEYADGVCGIKGSGDGERKRKRQRKRGGEEMGYAVAGSPLSRAVAHQNTLLPLSPNPTSDALAGLYLSRICRTASHELGHCFGIDHCIYYACCMQGSASITEDARQPPYLCPIDLAKVLSATGADVKERYEVLLDFCEQHGDAHMFVAFGEWIRGRLGQIEKLPLGKKKL
ncbi:hypothetical protein NHQ30_001809 [Ciborinia camelliae]|nr:hypothetical protein NHQ30_001809 [Ciborinia camelliae]